MARTLRSTRKAVKVAHSNIEELKATRKAHVALSNIEELKARSETEWLSPLNLMEANALGACLWRTQCNIKADLAQCKTTMSPEDHTACLEYALYDYIPHRVIGDATK